MENMSHRSVSPADAAEALSRAEATHRRAAYAGIEPWWVDALSAAGMAAMAVGLISQTLWGALLGAALFVVGSFVFTARQRRRGTVHDKQAALRLALLFGGLYGLTYAVGQLLTARPSLTVLVLGALALAAAGFVFLRWSAHRAARALVATQGQKRTLS